MKKIIIFALFIIPLSHAVTPLQAKIANTLANNNIIVNSAEDPTKYRLDDKITRSETVWVALKVWEIQLPEKYFCKNYFKDVAYNALNNWVCRAIEIASDYGIISRKNGTARPEDPISRSEALAVIMLAGKISYPKNINRGNYPRHMKQWQVDIVEAAYNYGIILSAQDFIPNAPATRSDVFWMIYNMRYASKNTGYVAFVNFPSSTPALSSAPELPIEPEEVIPPEEVVEEEVVPTTTVGTLAQFDVKLPKDIKINTPFDITIRASDSSGATLTNYTGKIYFDIIVGTRSDISSLALDDGYAFTATEKWVLTIKNVTIKKAWSYELDVYEIAGGGIVKPFFMTAIDPAEPANPASPTQIKAITVTAPKDIATNTAFDMTVSIVNSTGAVIPNYTGTIYFGANNLEADIVFPMKSYTFTEADKWKKVFSGFQIKQIGNYELRVYEIDTIPDGTSRTVKITAKAPTN
jgi:hypothetical protein